MTTDTCTTQPKLDIDAELSDLLVRAKANLEEAWRTVEGLEEQLIDAREARDLAKRQLQNAYLATGRNSDGTERKQRGKKHEELH